MTLSDGGFDRILPDIFVNGMIKGKYYTDYVVALYVLGKLIYLAAS